MTTPEYKHPFDPDHCFDCGAEFDFEECVFLPFYTVIIDCHIKRCCPKCFPAYKERWMG